MDEDCAHEFDSYFCEKCGGYLGEICSYCGEYYDGGDHIASMDDYWCKCDHPVWPEESNG